MKKQLFYTLLGISFALTLMSPSCEKESGTNASQSTNETTSEKDQVKKIDPISYSFENGYKGLWDQVDSLQKVGLYRSALDVVNVIFDSAKVENNAPQVVKAVIHKMKYNSYLKEDDFIIALDELNGISSESTFPLKQIIHSVTAQTYWTYYQNNRWKFMNRTQTVNFKNDDLRTWDLNKIADHVKMHYLLSLTNADSLQHTNIKDFSEILVTYNETYKQRPTLYDFLGHRAFNHFKNTEAALSRPADKFIMKGVEYFSSDKAFVSITTDSKDTLSNQLYAVRILQSLTKFHMNDIQPEAAADLAMIRLQFALDNSVEDKRKELYLAALNQLAEQYKDHEVYAEIRYHCASYFNREGSLYDVQHKEYQWEKKKAIEICQEAILRYPESHGAEKCEGLMTSIRHKNISFNTEMAYQPNSKGKMLISYKNLDSIYFKMVKVDWDYYYKNDLWGDELITDLMKKPAAKSWSKKLVNPGDFQSHSTEIAIDVPDNGQYVILASPDSDFKVKNNAVAHGAFWASNLSYTFRRNDDETIDVIVTDRESGKPLKGVNANILIRKYNYDSRKYDVRKQESYTSDANGTFTIRSKSQYRYIYVDLQYGKDRYNNASQLYQYRPYSRNKPYYTTYFFTDRSIYRPGQTVHFKGIRIKHQGDEHSIEKGKSSTVTFFDANYQKVSDLKLVTNEYGTFSGTFTTPMGSMNGQMHIGDKYGSKYFSVEEYKRPKFEVDFEPIKGEYKIGEKITVKGIAKAYAGSTVDGAKVQYRITRSCNFPSWIWYRWGYYPYSQSVEIDNGTLTTDESGEFKIEFKAKEDRSIDSKFFPWYSYSISADVTDINGETRSAAQWVNVGYNCMNLSVGLSSSIERSEKNRFKVYTTNLNGEKLDAKGSITVTKLIEPEGVFRTSNWSKPDIQEFSKEEYRKLFPHDAYDDELDQTKFKKGREVLNIPFNTGTNDSIDFKGMSSWEPGKYIVEAISIDPFGTEVKDIQYITILNKKGTENPTSDIWLFTPLKTYCEPGENAEILISSAVGDLKVFYEIEHKGKIVDKKFISLGRSQKRISITIEEKHRGNLTVHFSTVKFGRSFVSKQAIIVPFSNKELDIEFETFRNKLLPGSKEEWKLKIRGPKGDKVAAEMLATMYDASLDAFASNSFYMQIYNSYYSSKYWSSYCFNANYSQLYNNEWNPYYTIPHRNYDHLNWWGYTNQYYYGYRDYYDHDGLYYSIDGNMAMSRAANFEMAESEEMAMEELAIADAPAATGAVRMDEANQQGLMGGYKKSEMEKDKSGNFSTTISLLEGKESTKSVGLANINARKNFNETAFFYPQLETNENGEVIVKFTIPESLTKWKFLGMAHTKDLKVGYIQEEIVTQKDLMVIPNAPRFLREGDKMTFTAKVSNLSDKDLKGDAQLLLFDAITNRSLDTLFNNGNPVIEFEAKKGQSAPLSWDIEVPFGIGAVTYKVVAKAGNFTDGEEMALPVLSNRMLVTESLPLPSKGIGTKEFKFEKLVNSEGSTSLKHHKLTLEYTSNPAWYAVQAMPYMMEYPYECAEQIFTRFYANSLASNIMNSNPKIKAVFEQWKTSSPEAFLSNLEKNQELKSLMLEETPWVLDAQNESERKKRVALLFDLNKMDNELSRALRKLKKYQVSNGGWPWFPGMEESRYITQHIVTGMGHLDHLGVNNIREDRETWNMVLKGINYLDVRLAEDFEWLKAHDPHYLTEQRISQIQVQYLYARSYFQDVPLNSRTKEAFDYYQQQAKKYWTNFNLYNEGMIALQAKRYEVEELPEMIMASLKERAIVHDEFGMYWKDNKQGYYWYQAPIETQALLIEAFDEVTNDTRVVEELKVWLLKQKQTTDWKTTKATAEACYALLLRGTDLLANDEIVEIKINGKKIDPEERDAKVEAGTGYFKTSWSSDEIKPEMGNISVTRKTEGVSWGAMYWQYFEDLDKITTHETPLRLSKKLFLVQNTESGEVITPVENDTDLQPGDKIRVRIELRSDRNMEYVHMKDMRAAGFEPINVFSRYKWQDGLGYYESTKDAATNFFIEYLPKGTYVFEYDLRVSHAGDFSNGITTIQCMYAPEFTSHSEGIRVSVNEME